jgi:hypothetical protein
MLLEDFIPETAAIELAKKLPSLAKHDYQTIDKLMQKIAKKHQITGSALHKIFVKKYKKTPDSWIKNKLNEKSLTTENIEKTILIRKGNNNDLDKIRSFYNELCESQYGKIKINVVTEWINNLIPSLNESIDSEVDAFHEKITQLSKNSHVPIKIGSKICLLQAIVDLYSNSIILKGFKQPKTITDIKIEDDSVKQIEFEDGSVFPEKYEFSTTELGHDLMNTMFFNNTQDFEKSLIMLNLIKPEKYKLATKLLSEEIQSKLNIQDEVNKFVDWAAERLKLENIPKVQLSKDTEEAQVNHHTGGHVPGSDVIWVYAKNRNLVDILRTVVHELTHVRQHELNMIKPNDSYPGSPIEAQADMVAGKLMKIYGKENNHIFQ